MTETYKTIFLGGSGEIIEKKSKFIANTAHVETEEEAVAFIESIKKKYWDARHNCSAYIIGTKQEIMRCSDDGEPSQTAGKPMLDVLVGEGICNTVVVVTRYFGGTLLGTGGLVRAYSGATKEGLAQSTIVEKKLADNLLIETDYNGIGKIQYILAQAGLNPMNVTYTDKVTLTVAVPVNLTGKIEADLTEGTYGRAILSRLGTLYFGEVDGEVILFDH
ncbi:MAG: YigZ family protein [Lachnospiraceae bacterium]